MSDIIEKVYKGRDNSIKFQLDVNGVPLTATEIADITKVELYFGGTYYESDTDFPMTKDGPNGSIELAVGTLPEGKDKKTELIVYDSINTNGIVWTQFSLTISGDATPPV